MLQGECAPFGQLSPHSAPHLFINGVLPLMPKYNVSISTIPATGLQYVFKTFRGIGKIINLFDKNKAGVRFNLKTRIWNRRIEY